MPNCPCLDLNVIS